MQQNAFELLKQGVIKSSQTNSQSQKSQKRRRSSAEQQNAYSTCPVCGNTSIPTWFLEQHVTTCLDKPLTQNATQGPASASGSTRTKKSTARVPPAVGAATVPPLPRPGKHAAAQQETQPDEQQQQERTTAQQDAKSATVNGAVNAFAVLTAASAAHVPIEATMFLEACSDGSWITHFWSEGSPPPKPSGVETAWTASTTVTMPKQDSTSSTTAAGTDIPSGSTKLKVHLATNLPSGYGTAVDWSNPLLPSNSLQQQQQQQQQQVVDGSTTAAGDGSRTEATAAAAAAAATEGGVRWRSSGLSVLISALQKCIRRGKAASATRLALILLKEPKGPDQLLRRLAIICLEDGLLHPQLPLVVWAMMAVSKGYTIGGSLANALLSITYQMAAVGHRDFLPDADAVSGPAAAIYQAPRTWPAIDALLPPSSSESLLVKCILIRAAYGGMAGDKEMLMRFAGLWLARFSGTTLPPPGVGCSAENAEGQVSAAAAAGKSVEQQHHQQQQQQGVGDAGGAGSSDIQMRDQAVIGKHTAQVEDAKPKPQQQQQQQIPGRQDPGCCFAAAPAAVSPWLAFLRSAYQALPKPGAQLLSTKVTSLGPLERKDIPEAAIDFHVSNISEHLLQQPAVQDTLQRIISSSTVLAAQAQSPDGLKSLVNRTLWQFRSSYNSKLWLQNMYESTEEWQRMQHMGTGYAWQVLQMELKALQRFQQEQKATRVQLMPLWKVIAMRADAYSVEQICKKLY